MVTLFHIENIVFPTQTSEINMQSRMAHAHANTTHTYSPWSPPWSHMYSHRFSPLCICFLPQYTAWLPCLRFQDAEGYVVLHWINELWTGSLKGKGKCHISKSPNYSIVLFLFNIVCLILMIRYYQGESQMIDQYISTKLCFKQQHQHRTIFTITK